VGIHALAPKSGQRNLFVIKPKSFPKTKLTKSEYRPSIMSIELVRTSPSCRFQSQVDERSNEWSKKNVKLLY
jgi:hypothetical protein